MTKDNFILELSKIGINITDIQLLQLDKYFKLLCEWNEKINLTAITKEEDVYLKHFYDSATLCKVLDLNNVNSLCDVGTGAGFPGMVIKILFPNIKVTLVDALEKRINFLNIVINELGLKNIDTIHERAEIFALSNREKYDVVTARAVASLPTLIEFCAPIVKENMYFIPLKANISQEIIESKHAIEELNLKIENICEFKLPVEESNRTIILFKKLKKTNHKYPRKFADIKNKPL